MTAASNPQYQILPEHQRVPQAPQAAEPQVPEQQAPTPDPWADGDRTMSPEEAEAYFRGEVTRDEEYEQELTYDQEQSEMAADFFQSITPDAPRRQSQTPEVAAAPPPQPPDWQQAQPQPDAATLVDPTPQPGQPAPLVDPSQVPAAPHQVPVQTQASPQEAALQAQVTLLQQTNQALQQQIAGQVAQPQPQAQAPQAGPPQPVPSINVPDQYMHALTSDDMNVRRAALNDLLNATQQSALQTVAAQVDTYKQQIRQDILGEIQMQSETRRISEDMYGTYPELEPYRPLVAQAVSRVAPGASPAQWNADVRDLVAEQLANIVPGLHQKIQVNRAQRIAQMQPGAVPSAPMAPMPQYPQAFPQAQSPQAQQMPYQHPQQPVGGAHGAPQYMRDVSGNLVQVPVQQAFAPGVQASPRPEFHGGYSMAEDVQRTLFS